MGQGGVGLLTYKDRRKNLHLERTSQLSSDNSAQQARCRAEGGQTRGSAPTTGPGDREGESRKLLNGVLETVQTEAMDLLSPLRRYDEQHGGDLIRTLHMYFATGCNATRTAEALYLHRSGLLYRLRRIEQLLAVRLDTFPQRVALEIAVLAANPEPNDGRNINRGNR